MKHACFACLFLCLTTTFLLPQSNPVPLINQSTSIGAPISAPQPDPKAQARILDSYGKLPLSFEANRGQTDKRVKFLSRTSGYSLFLTGDEAVLTLSGKTVNKDKSKITDTSHTLPPHMAAPKSGGVLRMKLRNANPAANVTGVDELAGTSNYFIGNDPTKWRTGVPIYAKVKYEGIYSGIDLVYYGNQKQLEYDFIVAPGADPRRIAFDVSGAKRIRRDERGGLAFKVGGDEIRWHKPVVYQEKDGARQEIAARYAITAWKRVGFELANYDASRPLYIDPLIYSTYLGGSGGDSDSGIAVDDVGNAYVIGITSSKDFPTVNPLQPAYSGGLDAFVAKINPAGTALVYSTYLGGSGDDSGSGIAVDDMGSAYVIGITLSKDFPTVNPLQPAYGGTQDAFVAKINPAGTALVYSTYLGGSGDDRGSGIAVDSAGNAYMTGGTGSTDFPVTPGAFQTTCCGSFVTKLNATGSALVYSTYLDNGSSRGIAVDNAGNAYVTGVAGPDFPTTQGAFQTTYGGNLDTFVTKFNPTGSALIYSTYLGGDSWDYGTGIAVDSSGYAYVTGYTGSTNFPTMNPLQSANGGGNDAFVARINPLGSALVYSTYLGGSGYDDGYGIAVDSAGSAYITGWTDSKNFPLSNPLQKRKLGPQAAFVARISPTGSALVYSTYLGGSGGSDTGSGIAVDSSGYAYVTGYTGSTNFPTMNPLQSANGGGEDAFVAKMDVRAVSTMTLSSSPNPSTYGQEVIFTAVVTSVLGAPPDGETVTFKKGTAVLGTGTLSAGSARFTTSTLPVATNAINAVYGGDSNFAGSTSKAVSQEVNKATTTTTLASSLNPSKSGQAVTFTASVTPQFGGTPAGTVTFYDGTTTLKTATLSGGKAKFTTKTLASGKHTITATYNGGTKFIGSSASLMQTVN